MNFCCTLYPDVVKVAESESVYSEADDGKPRAIPASDFAAYFKSKSRNGAVVLREEFKVRA